MAWFKIISMEEFEDCWDSITKVGDVLETVQYEDLSECKRYVRCQYGPCGHDIRVKIEEVGA